MKKAYFAGGCFWCITPFFAELDGVQQVIAGYSGGREEAPAYENVKHQLTGHRESVCVHYDESKISYEKLLDVFLASIDPFDEGGQFIDRGHSYTTAIFWQLSAERQAALDRIAALEHISGGKCAVAVEEFQSFWDAEEEHQDFYRKHPDEFSREMEISGRAALTREQNK